MLNLISDPWIPVLRASGPDVIRPDQIAEDGVERLNWPRPDLNLACLELLIGLVYIAAPPAGEDSRSPLPHATTLLTAMAPLAPAFNLLGGGPRFMQDFEDLKGDPSPPDMLFIDSAGVNAAKNNSDLMVKRDRYIGLPLPLAAMALYTLQDFAPTGGAGHRTSMRGGGPMVTLLRPSEGHLWPMVWANVPAGKALAQEDLDLLPWMRPTETSEEKGKVTVPENGSHTSPDAEVFFGQPRRLRLVETDGLVTGVLKQTHGPNYTQWRHPLSPYYQDNNGQILPLHPKPGSFGFQNWRGVILQSENKFRAETVERWIRENPGKRCSLIVAGWAMDNMKPLDFLWSEQPVFPMSEESESSAIRMVEAAEQAAYALRSCVSNGTSDKGAGYLAQEAFFDVTQSIFEAQVAALSNGQLLDAKGWVKEMHKASMPLFVGAVMPGLSNLSETKRQTAVKEYGKLLNAFNGRGPFGKKIYDALGLEVPIKVKRKESA